MQKGFTLIEVLVSLTVLSIITAGGLAISFDAYRSSLVGTEADIFVHLLEQTRNQTLNNYQNSSQSLRITDSDFISLSNSSEINKTARNKSISISGPETISFTIGHGTASASSTYVFSYGSHNKVISISQDGSISY